MNAATPAASKSKSGAESESQSASAMTPQEYLAAAEAALASDRPLEFSRLMWLAAEAAFARLAQAHQMDSSDLHQLARALDKKGGHRSRYLGKLSTARALMHNAVLDYMEPYQLESAAESVKLFISEML